MSFSLSVALSSTSIKSRPPGGTFPTALLGLSRLRTRERHPSSVMQQGDDPHFGDFRHIADGHRLGTYVSKAPSSADRKRQAPGLNQKLEGAASKPKRESRRSRQMRRSREMSLPGRPRYDFNFFTRINFIFFRFVSRIIFLLIFNHGQHTPSCPDH